MPVTRGVIEYDEAFGEKLGERLRRALDGIAADMAKAIESAARSAPQLTLDHLNLVRAQVNALADALLEEQLPYAQRVVSDAYEGGMKAADVSLGALRRVEGELATAMPALHQQAINVLLDNLVRDFASIRQRVGRNVDDVFRQIALEAVRGPVVGYRTVARSARLIADAIKGRGLEFRDARGRRWTAGAYAKMVARTTTMEAHLQGSLNRLYEHGVRLVRVSSHAPHACPLCAPWESRVLSIDGSVKGFPTLAEARAAGLFHPNCRHGISAHFSPYDVEEAPFSVEEALEIKTGQMKGAATSKQIRYILYLLDAHEWQGTEVSNFALDFINAFAQGREDEFPKATASWLIEALLETPARERPVREYSRYAMRRR